MPAECQHAAVRLAMRTRPLHWAALTLTVTLTYCLSGELGCQIVHAKIPDTLFRPPPISQEATS